MCVSCSQQIPPTCPVRQAASDGLHAVCALHSPMLGPRVKQRRRILLVLADGRAVRGYGFAGVVVSAAAAAAAAVAVQWE